MFYTIRNDIIKDYAKARVVYGDTVVEDYLLDLDVVLDLAETDVVFEEFEDVSYLFAEIDVFEVGAESVLFYFGHLEDVVDSKNELLEANTNHFDTFTICLRKLTRFHQ